MKRMAFQVLTQHGDASLSRISAAAAGLTGLCASGVAVWRSEVLVEAGRSWASVLASTPYDTSDMGAFELLAQL